MKYYNLLAIFLAFIYSTPSFSLVLGPLPVSEPNSMFVFMAVGLTLFLVKKFTK